MTVLSNGSRRPKRRCEAERPVTCKHNPCYAAGLATAPAEHRFPDLSGTALAQIFVVIGP
jgi:hypothetical protein